MAMAMAMALTDGDNAVINKLPDPMTHAGYLLRCQLTLVLFLLSLNAANAGDWDITPRISVAEIFSDNINLDDDDKKNDLVTEISPGISVHGEGGRLIADVDYEMQNLIFLNESDASGSNHQLDASATAELAKDLFYVDATSSMGQSIVDANRTISNNNINNAGNRTDFYTYTLSPFIQSHFGGYADGSFRYTYGQVNYDDDGISDTTENSFDAGLVSGRKFGPLSWTANYNHTELDRDTNPDQRFLGDEKFENADATARYRISNRFSLVGQAGYANNDFDTSEKIENGSYWSVGGFLQPNRYYSLEAQQGSNLKTVTVGLYPTRRTSLVVTYRDRDVGLNPGEVWSGSFSHYTRRTTWKARYEEDTTTEQQLLLQEGFAFFGVDPLTGETNPSPQPGDLVVIVPLGPVQTLTDEIIERKRATGTFGMKTGKTGLRFTVFDEQRRYLTSLREEETKGFIGSLNRRIAPHTNSTLSGWWQRRTDDDREGQDSDFWYVQAQLSRQIRQRLNASVSYTFTRQDSDNNRDDYSENRVEARLTAFF